MPVSTGVTVTVLRRVNTVTFMLFRLHQAHSFLAQNFESLPSVPVHLWSRSMCVHTHAHAHTLTLVLFLLPSKELLSDLYKQLHWHYGMYKLLKLLYYESCAWSYICGVRVCVCVCASVCVWTVTTIYWYMYKLLKLLYYESCAWSYICGVRVCVCMCVCHGELCHLYTGTCTKNFNYESYICMYVCVYITEVCFSYCKCMYVCVCTSLTSASRTVRVCMYVCTSPRSASRIVSVCMYVCVHH